MHAVTLAMTITFFRAMTSLQIKEEEEDREGGGVNVSVYKTSAASQLMPQHSAPAKRTYARGIKKKKSSLSVASQGEKSGRSQTSEIVMLPAGAYK